MQVTILYEDQDLLAINKPSGLIIHKDGRKEETSLVDWIKSKYPELEEVGEPLELASGEVIKRWGIVHRIDRETSGVVLIAKHQKAYLFLKKQFLKRDIEKSYHAIVHGDVRYDEGIINLPIGRHKSDFRKRATGKMVRGEMREAITHYKTLARKEGMSLVQANPQTGRTHQLRVHFADIGHPILEDKLYSVYKKAPIHVGRLALHAYAIEFELLNKELIKIIAPYPVDFSEVAQFFK